MMFAMITRARANLGNLMRSPQEVPGMPTLACLLLVVGILKARAQSQGRSSPGSGLGLDEHLCKVLGQSPTPSPPHFSSSVPGITKELAKEIAPAIANTPSRKILRKEKQGEDYKTPLIQTHHTGQPSLRSSLHSFLQPRPHLTSAI